MVKPILVMMSWRGGERLKRCLRSIAEAEHYFDRIVLSITGEHECDDMVRALRFQSDHPLVEVICTGKELPTMAHQAFWIDYLQQTQAKPAEWIYWLAYDDQVAIDGIEHVVDPQGNWPLKSNTVYFGPWSMRHETPEDLWSGDPKSPPQVWTSFPSGGSRRIPVLQWIANQLERPTYMQMSGSVIPFHNYLELRNGRPRKNGPMRIEMATALGSKTTHVAEFAEPVSIIYGRSNSDRATYGKAARKEDIHLIAWLARYTFQNPGSLPKSVSILASSALRAFSVGIGLQPNAQEEWRER